MAASPERNAAARPATRGPTWIATSEPPRTILSSSHAPAPAMIGAAIRKLNRAASVAIQADEATGRDGDPRAAYPGKERRGLRDADPERLRERQIADPAVGAADMIGHPQDRGADEEQDRHRAGRAHVGLDEVVEQDADNDRGQHRGDDEPREPPVRVTRERAVANRGEPGRHDAQPVAPEVDEQRAERPQVEHHRERQQIDERVVPAQQGRHEDQVPRTRDGQELGESLHDPHDDGLEDRIHLEAGRLAGLANEERGEHERDRGKELHEDVERRTGGVLEWIADRVAHDRCGMGL